MDAVGVAAPGADPFGHEGQAQGYAAYRPTYPSALLDRIWSTPDVRRGLAVDACCGTGKLTTVLAEHFEQVLGLDQSAEQLRHADRGAGNVEYRQADAALLEGVGDGSADVVAIAQALHWLDIPAFCTAARRALRPGGYLVVLGYGVCSLPEGSSQEAAFKRHYHETLGSYLPRGHKDNMWDCDRQLLDSGLANGGVAAARSEFEEPAWVWHKETRRMTADDFIGYLKTWSAYRRWLQAHPDEADPLEALKSQLVAPSGAEDALEVTFPFFLILARATAA